MSGSEEAREYAEANEWDFSDDNLSGDYSSQKLKEREEWLESILNPVAELLLEPLHGAAIRNLEVNFEDPNIAKHSNAVLSRITSQQHQRLLLEIRTVNVTGSGALGNWATVTEVISRAENLEEIHWDSCKAITPEIVSTLDSRNGSVKLHYAPSFDGWDSYESNFISVRAVGQEPQHESRSEARESIIGSTSLSSIKANVIYGGQTNIKDMNLMSRTLTSCPNLRELELNFRHRGCVFGGVTPYAFDFTIAGPIPPLEVVKLEHYHFGADLDGKDAYTAGNIDRERTFLRWPWNMIPYPILEYIPEYYIQEWDGVISLNYAPETHHLTNFDAWLSRMDWSHVHTLDLSYSSPSTPETMARLGKATTGLTTASFRSVEHYLEFLNSRDQGLESLHLCGIDVKPIDPLIEALHRHRATLKTMEIHWHAPHCAKRDRPGIHIDTSYLYPLSRAFSSSSAFEPLASSFESDDLALEILASLSTSTELRLHIDDSSKPKPSPRKQEQIDQFWKVWKAWDQRAEARLQDDITTSYLDKITVHPYDAFEEARVESMLAAKAVCDLFETLRAVRKGGEPLERLIVYMGPWDKLDSGPKATGFVARVWKAEIDPKGVARCAGGDYASTKTYGKIVWKDKSWAEAVDEWIMGV